MQDQGDGSVGLEQDLERSGQERSGSSRPNQSEEQTTQTPGRTGQRDREKADLGEQNR
jgi:hypothetical protein